MFAAVQTGWSLCACPAQSIHLREKNIVGPTERPKMRKHFLARREGPAFFDEDDVCVGFRNQEAARLNYLRARGHNISAYLRRLEIAVRLWYAN